jgi:Flp pilus assembly protein TadG
MTKRFESVQTGPSGSTWMGRTGPDSVSLWAREPAAPFAPSGFLRGSETGSALTEFAFVVILLFVMLFGIIDFGRALYTYHFVSNAARTATRWAMVNGASCNADNSCNGTAPMNTGPASAADVQNYVRGLTPGGIDPSKVTTTSCGVVGVTCPASPPSCTNSNGAGCTVQVTVSYPFSFLVPLVYKKSITMQSTSQMIISH